MTGITKVFDQLDHKVNAIWSLLLASGYLRVEALNRVALDTFSFFDSGKKPSKSTESERFYHGFVLGLLVDFKGRYM